MPFLVIFLISMMIAWYIELFIRSYSLAFSSLFNKFLVQCENFPLYATLYVIMRAIWAYTCTLRHDARLLILCFRFHISLVAIRFAYTFFDLDLFTFYPATSTLLKMSGEDDGESVDPREPNHDPDDSEPHRHSINPW